MDSILPILLIFFIIFSIIFIPYFIFIKEGYKYLSFKTARKIEIIGYSFLFISLIWELLFKDFLSKNLFNLDLFYIQEKLNIIFNTILNEKNNSYNLIKSFNILKIDKFLEIQLFAIDLIEILLKIISTILIAIGRIHELCLEKTPSK